MQRTFKKRLREHLKNDICSGLSECDREIYERMFGDESMPLQQILSIFLDESLSRAPNDDAAHFLSELQSTTTKEQRAKVYAGYYCTALPGDSNAQKQFKQKYRERFEAGEDHDAVVRDMKIENEEVKKGRVKVHEGKLNDLQMAQKGHQKNQARKEEKRKLIEEQKELEKCGFRGCDVVLDLVRDEGIECAVCEWILRRVRGHEGERGVVYCCVEHAKEDFVSFTSNKIAGRFLT